MEIWKNIKGFENKYQVSNLGNIKSLNYEVEFGKNKRIIKGKILKFNFHKRGYSYVHVGKKRTVHRIVAENFIPNPFNKQFVNHINGIKTDNRVENLEWVTHSENCIHAYVTKLNKPNKGHYKIQEHFVQEIRNSKLPKKELCHKYNISRSTIYLIQKSMGD